MFSSTYLVKFLQRLSYSILSITLSCKDFLYNVSKVLIVCWSLSYSFLYLFYLFKITSYKTLLPFDKAHADAADIGIAIKPIPVRLKVLKLDVVAIITNVSNDFSIVVIVSSFLIFLFSFVVFVFEVCNHFLNAIDVVFKTVNII